MYYSLIFLTSWLSLTILNLFDYNDDHDDEVFAMFIIIFFVVAEKISSLYNRQLHGTLSSFTTIQSQSRITWLSNRKKSRFVFLIRHSIPFKLHYWMMWKKNLNSITVTIITIRSLLSSLFVIWYNCGDYIWKNMVFFIFFFCKYDDKFPGSYSINKHYWWTIRNEESGRETEKKTIKKTAYNNNEYIFL